MRLEGSLDALGVADLLTLLATTRKTGTLDLTDHADGRRGLVHVTEGRVTGGTADVTRAGLLRRVVASSDLDVEALRRAVGAVEGSEVAAAGDGVVDALRDTDDLAADALAELARDHLRDVVVDLLRWSAGDFSFRVDLPPADDLGVALAADELLETATARLERWRAAAATVPGDDVVLRLVDGRSEQVVLEPDEWRLLGHLDGRRTVSDVVGDDPVTALETLEALAALVARGLVGEDSGDAGGPDAAALLLAGLEEPAGREAPPVPADSEPVAGAEPAPEAPEAPEAAAPPAPEPEPEPEPEIVVAEQTPAAGEAVPAPRVEDEVALAPVPAVEAEDSVDVGEVALAAAAADLGEVAWSSEPTPSRYERVHGARRPEHPEPGTDLGAAADGVVTRDPAVDKALLLRLIVGVRGL